MSIREIEQQKFFNVLIKYSLENVTDEKVKENMIRTDVFASLIQDELEEIYPEIKFEGCWYDKTEDEGLVSFSNPRKFRKTAVTMSFRKSYEELKKKFS